MILEFGPFVIDSLQRRVFHGTFLIPLAPKPFQVLLYLAANDPGRIVEKSELLQTIWKTVSVSPSNLTQTIFVLRNSLKRRDAQTYIVTIPGRGYQFAAEVKRHQNRSFEILRKAHAPCLSCREATRLVSPIQTILSSYTIQSLRTVVHQSRRAMRHKPNCAAPYVDYANALCLSMNAGDMAAQQALPAVQDAVLRAMEIDPEGGSAYAPLGFLRCHLDRDWPRAEEDFQQSIDRCPKDLMARHWYGELLAALQRFDESLKILRDAEKLYPQSALIQTDIAQTLFYAKEYTDCEAQLLRTINRSRRFSFANILLGCTYRFKRRYKEAILLLENVVSQENSAVAFATLAASHAPDDKHRASEIVKKLQRSRTKCYVSPCLIAFAAAGLGNTNVVLEFLEQGERENDYWFLWFRNKTAFDPLRREPRFQELLKKAHDGRNTDCPAAARRGFARVSACATISARSPWSPAPAIRPTRR